MAVDHKATKLALRNLMLQVSGIPSERAYENEGFAPPNPTAGNTWLRETYLPGEENRIGTNLIEALGLVQYDLFYPEGTGAYAADELADAIKSALRPGRATTLAGLTIRRTQRLRGRTEESGWYMVPVEVYWRLHASND
jgi:hypothetical protein